MASAPLTTHTEEDKHKSEFFDNPNEMDDAKNKVQKYNDAFAKYRKEKLELQDECAKLEIECELNEAKIEFLRKQVDEENRKLEGERNTLDKVYCEVWSDTQQFFKRQQPRKMGEEQEIIWASAAKDEKPDLKKQAMRLKGEIEALKFYNDVLKKKIDINQD